MIQDVHRSETRCRSNLREALLQPVGEESIKLGGTVAMELRIRDLPVEADQQRGFSGALESSRRRVTELPGKHEYIISSFQSRTRRDKSARLLEALDPTGLVDIAPYPSI